jgi:nucleoside-triphosphatase THEP1
MAVGDGSSKDAIHPPASTTRNGHFFTRSERKRSMGFKKATKAAAKLRLGLIGPAGSGKTMSALRIAHGLGGRVAVIDTERGSASLYSGERGLGFDVLELETYEAEKFIQAIAQAEAAGYDVLIIDSLSHAWAGKGGILEFVDKAAKRSGGGSFSGWRDATPLHNQLVDAILGAKLHIICTLRSKVEHVIEQVNGRTQVRKVGLQPVQRDGLEYEFTVVGDVTQDHELIITKTRAAWLKDQIIREAGEDLGKQLAAWLSDGLPSPVVSAPTPARTAEATGGTGDGQPVEEPLAIRIATHISQAGSVRTLGKIADRIDALVSEGQLSPDEAADLHGAVSRRHDVIEPRGAVNGVA